MVDRVGVLADVDDVGSIIVISVVVKMGRDVEKVNVVELIIVVVVTVENDVVGADDDTSVVVTGTYVLELGV